MSETYQPKTTRRKKVHGFLKRKSTRTGQNTLLRRRRKGRSRIAL